VKDPSQASFVNLLRAGRQRTVDVDEEEEEEEVKTGSDGSAVAKRRAVRKTVLRPMPLVLAG
jgi:hypothetical protein